MSLRKLQEALSAAMRAAKVPSSVAAKVLVVVDEASSRYKISSLQELFSMPEWYQWLFLIKGVVAPIARILRSEGYCNAVYYVVTALSMVDERIDAMIKEWIKERCSAGLDPCCSNPPCCNVQ
ncbi:hypothetical protein Pyrfu_1414 [Pyrolobus fumarii 1A]|uniref:Uncharacterized protein n=1 Tax=Pyrolobus fumarii (strain DSM 11204 / 1A) TaxID=694429 RepID=G0EH48_PYRF1|nr:hypothetical protein [Pyrolobus fumarii]AEM39272.1 hypothetical protein Pyrfu_1414 [Pyrolobus fumarii 1A]